MEKAKLEELENLFNKYGVKNKELVERESKFLKIETYKVDLNIGATIYRDKLVKNGGNGSACIIVPLFENNDVLMVVQPRVFSLRGVMLDFPSGYIEKDEDVKVAALRELKEETGYTASNIEKIASYYQDEGVSDAIINIFVAKGIKKVSNVNLDKDEYLDSYITSFDSLDELVDRGYIKSGGSQLAISKVKLLKGEGKC